MNQVVILDNSRPEIGLYTRNATDGDEFSLVKQFVNYYCDSFLRSNKKSRLAVFIEPRIESGFPDIVFASYLPSIIDNWSDEREKLDIYDLKLLSHLCYARNLSGAKIITKLGFTEKQTITSLEKLMDARLISYRSGCWRIRKLRDIFSIIKLIAVEAKLNDIRKVVDQSFHNTWFASHSYALTNASNPNTDTVRLLSKYGIGLYCKGIRFKKFVEAKQYILPSSYLSYQFNEWIGKAITREGGY
jgi:hypothetical protein